MRAIVNTGPGVIEFCDLPLPRPQAGQVRVRTACCGICATDLEMIAGWKRTGFPSVPGHEWSGVVDAVGTGVDAGLVGKSCVAENVLADGGEVGFEHPGGYAEFLLTQAANVRLLPDGLDLATAALIEPLAVAVRGVGRLGLTDRRNALVIGDGPLGLLMVALLHAGGVSGLVCLGGRPKRLALATALGASSVGNYHEAAVPANAAYANVVEASGSAAGMATALACAAPQGRVLVIGDYGSRQDQVNWNAVLLKELTLVGSNASAGAWDEAVRLAVSGAVPLARLVSKLYRPAQAAEAFASVRTSREVVKNLIDWRAVP